MKRLLLSHDLGTSGDKATLFTAEGLLLASRVQHYSTHYDSGNRAEQNPEDWWNAVCSTTQALLRGIDASEIAAVSLSGQMMGCLCVDRTGIPLRPSIIYSDQRATVETESLLQHVDGVDAYRITGHRLSPSYSVEKLMWVRANQPEIFRATYKMLNAKDYINFRLTGQYLTDYNDASGTNCFDINTSSWSERMIEAADFDPELLPAAKQSTFVAGGITNEASEATGLRKNTPVVIGAGDGGCATVGAGCVEEGVAYNYLGSSSWISTATKQPVIDEAMRTFTWSHPVPGLFQPCGTMQTAGSAIEWVAELLYRSGGARDKAVNDPLEQMNHAAVRSIPGANGIMFLPYLLGERSPRWNPDAKGAWIGLRLNTKHDDLVRAAFEGIAFNLEIILSVLRQHIPVDELTLIGGGAKGYALRQIIADVLDVAIAVPDHLEEATSMGAAIIGGVGVGLFDFVEGSKRFDRIVEHVEPNKANVAKYDALKPLFEECYNSLQGIMTKL